MECNNTCFYACVIDTEISREAEINLRRTYMYMLHALIQCRRSHDYNPTFKLVIDSVLTLVL